MQNAPGSGSGSVPMDVDKLYAMLNAMRGEGSSHGGSKVICYNCDEVGHFAKDCPKPQRPRRRGKGGN